jgi:hypothetical protein
MCGKHLSQRAHCVHTLPASIASTRSHTPVAALGLDVIGTYDTPVVLREDGQLDGPTPVLLVQDPGLVGIILLAQEALVVCHCSGTSGT